MKISKNKKCITFSCPKDHSTQKLGSYVKRCALQRTDTQTVRQTDRHESKYRGHPIRVSGIFFQLIIKDRSNTVYGNTTINKLTITYVEFYFITSGTILRYDETKSVVVLKVSLSNNSHIAPSHQPQPAISHQSSIYQPSISRLQDRQYPVMKQ